ncbi:hypothetical protein AAG906_026007 [Vitis piasezkii]
MRGRHRHVTDKEDEKNLDDDGDADDVYMYPIDMHPHEQHTYRIAVRASKAT